MKIEQKMDKRVLERDIERQNAQTKEMNKQNDLGKRDEESNRKTNVLNK